MGLELSGIPFHICSAFDNNRIANETYKHTFGEEPIAGDIKDITCKKLDQWGADLWTMSPPCQPYTRLGKQRDIADPRAEALLCLSERLWAMRSPPRMILVENVHCFQVREGEDI